MLQNCLMFELGFINILSSIPSLAYGSAFCPGYILWNCLTFQFGCINILSPIQTSKYVRTAILILPVSISPCSQDISIILPVIMFFMFIEYHLSFVSPMFTPVSAGSHVTNLIYDKHFRRHDIHRITPSLNCQHHCPMFSQVHRGKPYNICFQCSLW